jgi:hypothetical protein
MTNRTNADASATTKAYVDIDEWRDVPRRHRYVHGGFDDTHTRFSIYLPPEEHYAGRFFQYLEGGAGGHENLLASGGLGDGMMMDWIFDLAFDEFGGYLVESNQGHFPGEGLGFGNDYELFGASADSAVFAKTVAAGMYGAEPHHGYVWGVSGGGARSGRCLENRPDVWQGGVPHVGIGQATQWSPWALLWLVGRDKFAQIIDAVEPGGTGDPFDGLSNVQREALAELYRRGFPRGAENQLAPFTAWAFPWYSLLDDDPAYFDDFWNVPGYLGHDAPELLASVLVDEKAAISRIVPASEVDNLWAQMAVRLATAGASGSDPAWGFEIEADDPERMFMARVRILSGAAAGQDFLVSGVDSGVLSPFSERTPGILEAVVEGDEIQIDNRDFVAFCYYHRYATLDTWSKTPDRVQPELDPWGVDGRPIYPQRAIQPVGNAAPATYKATIDSKMIYIQNSHDAQVWPTTIFPYDAKMRENLGDRVDDHYRLWFVENAPHGTPEFLGPALTSEKDPGVWRSRLVSYDGVTAQALREVVAWVEEDIAPTFCTGAYLTRDNRLMFADTAAERGGVQPVVSVRANGTLRAEVKVGEKVDFVGLAEQPPGAGVILASEWDYEGTGNYVGAEIGVDVSKVELVGSYVYARAGTYFVSFRVSAHRHGAQGVGPAVTNLARARVVVCDD